MTFEVSRIDDEPRWTHLASFSGGVPETRAVAGYAFVERVKVRMAGRAGTSKSNIIKDEPRWACHTG